jgi:hypothetical protein
MLLSGARRRRGYYRQLFKSSVTRPRDRIRKQTINQKIAAHDSSKER